MSTLWYVSRTDGAHDRKWVDVVRSRGHHVEVLPATTPVRELRARAGTDRPDGVVAGPLTDALPRVVDADIAPVLGVCWAFDVLHEMEDAEVREVSVRALRRADLVHVDCHYLRDRLVGLGVERDRISVAAWGIDLEEFTSAPRDDDLRASVGFGPEDVVVLTARSWEPVYAVDVVLEGFALAHRADPRLRLAWAGDGSLRERLLDRAETLALAGVVVPLGVLDRRALLGWMRSADVYASAALADGSSLTLMEAMACGLPAVVTDLPSNREWVTGPQTGCLVPAGDVTAFADGLLAAVTLERAPELGRAVLDQHGDWRRNREVIGHAVDRLVGAAP